MSATRDKNQKSIFVFENFYRRYRESQAQQPSSRNVLKAQDVQSAGLPSADAGAAKASPKVEPYQPPELLGQRRSQKAAGRPELSLRNGGGSGQTNDAPPTHPVATSPFQNAAIQNLKQNLMALN